VNRPETEEEFLTGNRDLTARLLSALEKAGNPCPVLLTSSIQALRDNPYGRSKLAGEDLVRSYGARTGAKTLIYRLPNLFGKWCRPNYNSVVATFCHNIARDLPITVSDPAVSLTLCYIDDVVDEFLRALKGEETAGADGLCAVPVTHTATLGEIVDLLHQFHDHLKAVRDVAAAGDPCRFLCKETLFHVSLVSPGGGGLLPPEDECG
jgi:UDP-2-acetamido-2,6-beta-L-arabino-hexul-4-ose reductase